MSSFKEKVGIARYIRDDSIDPDMIFALAKFAPPQNSMDFPKTCGLLTELELDLTDNYDATALIELLVTEKVTAQTLLAAFRKRATIANHCTNCLTELLPEAMDDAKRCDDHLSRFGKPIGPLHGLPVSVKEQIEISGHKTNAGFVTWADRASSEDAHIVKSLKRLGAVVFARTTEPQSLMHLETSTNMYGPTVNPRNRNLTAGGSSGGEGALMAMHGTPLGIGGDIGGSIRVPASLNGLYGYLPSIGRISGAGVINPTPGCDSIHGSLGPFTRSLRDLELFCTAYSSDQPWVYDPSLFPSAILAPNIGLQLQPERPLRVGILAHDGVLSPLPPCRYVMNKIQEKLSSSSAVQLVSFTPYKHQEAWRIVSANYFEDGGDSILSLCKEGGEPVLPMTEWIIGQCRENMPLVGDTLQKRKAARDAFRQAYNAHWNEAGVDVVLTPITPSTAPPLGAAPYWGYTAFWNLLGYTSIALPATELMGGWSDVDLSNEVCTPEAEIEKPVFEHYSWEASKGMPLGVQVVAKRLHDGLLMQAARIIENALK